MAKGKKNVKLVNGVLYKRDGNEYAGSVSLTGSVPPTANLITPAQATPVQGSVASSDDSLDSLYGRFTGMHVSDSVVKINTNYPYPQANSLSKVASVVDAVSGMADTDEGIAAAIDVVPRQGSYYATAAGYLGLVTEVGSAPRSWSLTPLGAVFLESDVETRVDLLNKLVAQMPAADTVGGDESMISNEIEIGEGLSTATASRRAAALTSWVKTLTASNAGESLMLESDSVAGRIVDAANVASASRERARQRAHVEPVYEVCMECFMQKTPGGCSCW